MTEARILSFLYSLLKKFMKSFQIIPLQDVNIYEVSMTKKSNTFYSN